MDLAVILLAVGHPGYGTWTIVFPPLQHWDSKLVPPWLTSVNYTGAGDLILVPAFAMKYFTD